MINWTRTQIECNKCKERIEVTREEVLSEQQSGFDYRIAVRGFRHLDDHEGTWFAIHTAYSGLVFLCPFCCEHRDHSKYHSQPKPLREVVL